MTLSHEDTQNLAVWVLGPWLIGSCLDFLLQGILFCQFAHYWSWYWHDDKTWLKLAVAGLALMTTLKSIQTFALIWIQDISYFGDIDGAVELNYTAWWQFGNPLMVACIGFYVQCYFCYRLWAVSKNPYVVIAIATIFVFALAAAVLATYYITKVDVAMTEWFAAHLSAVFAGDILMSSVTAYFLLRSRKELGPETSSLITALACLTFQTATPAAICAMLNLIFSQIWKGHRLLSTVFNQMLPKLYAISMMWTLNARRTIRAAYHSREPSEQSNPPPVPSRRGDVELGDFGIQFRPEVEAAQRVHVWTPVDGSTTTLAEKAPDP